MASHCKQSECDPPIIYRGVVVQWDEDHDERIITMLDKMKPEVIKYLAAVQEHEASLEMIWYDRIPEGWRDGGIEVEGDYWSITESRVIYPI